MRSTRVLFLDDSGKPDLKNASAFTVIAGMSIPSEAVGAFTRRVSGAKGRLVPKRGRPSEWELKTTDFLKPNPWNRAANRDLVFEMLRITRELGGTVYSAAICKARMKNPMAIRQSSWLLVQGIVEHFAAECSALEATGLIVSDWSRHALDEHISNCVAGHVASKNLPLHPSVYYASSKATVAIQVADLLAGATRMLYEGARHLAALDERMSKVRAVPQGRQVLTHRGYPHKTKILLF
jgi:hypothetical protein